MPTLTITTLIGGPQRYKISPNRETVTLGRSSKNDIQISCESVSGQHATLHKVEDGYLLRDRDSTNGTKLDGKKVSEIHLEGNMKVHLGDVAFDFVPDGIKSQVNERAKTSRADGDRAASHDPEPENNPVVLGLALMGSGLIALGFIVLLGIDAVKAIAERGQNFILGGGALIFAGIITLVSILFVTGRVKIPKLVLQFDDKDDEDENEEDDDDDSDEDSEEEDSEDDDEEVGKAPKEEDDKDGEEESKKD